MHTWDPAMAGGWTSGRILQLKCPPPSAVIWRHARIAAWPLLTTGVELGQACIYHHIAQHGYFKYGSGEVKESVLKEASQIDTRLRAERAGSEVLWKEKAKWGEDYEVQRRSLLFWQVQKTSYTFQRLQWSKSGTSCTRGVFYTI